MFESFESNMCSGRSGNQPKRRCTNDINQNTGNYICSRQENVIPQKSATRHL